MGPSAPADADDQDMPETFRRSLVEESPTLRAVELTDSHGSDQLRIEVGEMHPMSPASPLIDRLPVSGASAMSTADPRAADPAAERAVAEPGATNSLVSSTRTLIDGIPTRRAD